MVACPLEPLQPGPHNVHRPAEFTSQSPVALVNYLRRCCPFPFTAVTYSAQNYVVHSLRAALVSEAPLDSPARKSGIHVRHCYGRSTYLQLYPAPHTAHQPFGGSESPASSLQTRCSHSGFTAFRKLKYRFASLRTPHKSGR